MMAEEEIRVDVDNVIQEIVKDIQKEELESQTLFVSVKEMIQLYEKKVETTCETSIIEQSVMIETKHNPELGNNDNLQETIDNVDIVKVPVVVPMKFQNVKRFLPRRQFF
jgi:hypothetical protein